jgi:hypothetical protein
VKARGGCSHKFLFDDIQSAFMGRHSHHAIALLNGLSNRMHFDCNNVCPNLSFINETGKQ